MKQLHLTGKIACALLLTVAAVTGCKDKEPVSPPTPVVDAPAVTPPAATPTPAPEGGNMTPPAGTPAPDATTPAPAPTTEPPPPAR